MGRCPVRIALCGLLGCVLTLGVAWWCAVALRLTPRTEVIGVSASSAPCWIYSVAKAPGVTQVRFNWLTSEPIQYMANVRWGYVRFPSQSGHDPLVVTDLSAARVPSNIDSIGNIDASTTLLEDARGWPAVSMGFIARLDYDELAQCEVLEELRYGIGIGPESITSSSVILPLRPILKGFVADSLFYGAIAYAVLFGCRDVLRGWRKHCGRCRNCGYDLRGNLVAGCPECGWRRAATP